MNNYVDYILEQAKNLLAIDSPSGYTAEVTAYLLEEYKRLGYKARLTGKGGVLADLGGEGEAILLAAHVDTLGGMVAEVKGDGRLRITNIGGMNANNAEAENVRIRTYDGACYDGTLQLIDASIHVNGKYSDTARSWDTVEVVIDEPVSSKEDVEKLGIMTGNFVCFDPRTTITSSGYIKSRFLDDKLSTAILLGYAKYLKDEHITLPRKIYQHITVFEEVGHGGCGSVPEGTVEFLSVDMGCVGNGLACTEREVSICVKDSGRPLQLSDRYRPHGSGCKAMKAASVSQPTFIRFYGSDADAALRAGYDLRHGLIGPGVYASHGYERSHKDGVENTLKLLAAYIG